MNKVEDAITECTKHLTEKNAFGTEIEAYLTRYLLLLIFASFEEVLETAFISRAERSGDSFTAEYFKSEMPHKLQNVKISKLTELFKKFGSIYSTKFSDEVVVALQREVTAYGNIIRNRHMVAHETRFPQMTFNELKNSYSDSKIVINKIIEIINMP
jgi:hypothetical protein